MKHFSAELRAANETAYRVFLSHHNIPQLKAALCSVFLFTIAAGCGSPRSITVAPGTHLATTTARPEPTPSFTITAQPVLLNAAAECSGCSGAGYNSEVTFPVELSSSGFIGTVSLSTTGLPAAVVLAQSVLPVAVNVGDAPANTVVSMDLRVVPSAPPGIYPFVLIGTPLPGANSMTPVQIPVELTIATGW